MTAKIDYNASQDVNEPVDNQLILNPKLSKGGTPNAFLNIMWQSALHLLWHGDDPSTPFEQEKQTPVYDNILKTTFEAFKKKYHTALGKASFFVLNIPHLSMTGSDNMELLPLLQESLNTCFTTSDGKNRLDDVKKYWLSDEPEKLGAIFDPNDANAKKLYNKLKEKASGNTTPPERSYDPPLNSPNLKRTPLQQLRLAIATLNVKTVRELADYLEFIDKKGKIGNNRFGLYGVWKLSQLPLDSPLWNEIEEYKDLGGYVHKLVPKKIGIQPQYRPLIKHMALRILEFDKKHKYLLDGVHGGEGVFDSGELPDWLAKHRRNTRDPDSTAFSTFWRSVFSLNAKAVGIMDWLEWNEDHEKADPGNGRFGMRGVQLLSSLTSASKEWEESGNGHLTPSWRQSLIHMAKVLMDPKFAVWTFQMHEGDSIFEPSDMKRWLYDNHS